MRRCPEARDFRPLHFNIAVNQIIIDYTAARQKFAVLIEAVKRLFKTGAYRRHLAIFFRGECIQVFVCCFAWMDFVLHPSSPAINKAENARYGLASGSGKRVSIRRACALDTEGIRMDAERLRAEYASLTGASKPGTRRLYELVVGFVIAFRARACRIMPPI